MPSAHLLFSQHSSNPLEARPSDIQNQLYNNAYQTANEKAHPEVYATSSDPSAVYPETLQSYHQHLVGVVPGLPLGGSRTEERSRVFVKLDEDVEGDEQEEQNLANKLNRDFLDAPDYDEDMDGEWEIDPDHETLDANTTSTNIDGTTLNGDFDDQKDDLVDEEEVVDRDYYELDEEEELNTLEKKNEEEIEEITSEINDFYESLPQLSGAFRLIDRLGTGTFSSVYKAVDLQYHGFDNTPWLGFHPPMSSAHFQSAKIREGRMAFVAIKRIYVTSGPDRIRNELAIMKECRGARHVSQIITAFRCEDQVAIVMPYQRNEDFREYFETLPIEGIKSYFRCLLRALRDIHLRGIIHRDVKPANFLFDPATGQGTLCDFGLAQTFDKPVTVGACLHTMPTTDNPHGRIHSRGEYDETAIKAAQMDARAKSKAPSHSVGVPAKDQRMPMKANRAGTRGFRAPEVLFKCGMQSGAVDVWSAGVILLFFLTRKFPLFQSNDDVEALMEIAMIFGKKKMEGVATLHARKFSTNVPDLPQAQMEWHTFVEKINHGVLIPPEPNEHFYPYTLPEYKEKLLKQEADEPPHEEDDEDLKPLRKRRETEEEDEDEDLTPTSRSLKRKEREDDEALDKDAHPSGRRRTDSYSSSPLRFPVSSPSSSKPSSGSRSNLTNPSSPASYPGISPTASSSRLETTSIRPPCPPLQTQESYEKSIYDAMDLVSRLLEPESVKRITPAAALEHPFLVETVPDESVEGGMKELDDEDFVPHLFGDGVCGPWHFWDPKAGKGGVVVRTKVQRDAENEISRSLKKKAVKNKMVYEDEEGVVASEAEGEEDVVPPSDGEEDQCQWQEHRIFLLPGEGIAIGGEPCEFHKDYKSY